MSNQDLVRDFLRAQNLEQIGRLDEAVGLYEKAVAASFDAAGPYDRLIFIYSQQRRFQDVIRVAEASLVAVQTYEQKRSWYQSQIDNARKQMNPEVKPR